MKKLSQMKTGAWKKIKKRINNEINIDAKCIAI